jgi:serpin B
VRLALPRFHLETQLGLVPVLQQLGMVQAFGGDADFAGITDATRLAIGAVAHSAYIDVDEEGTEAAAATGITMAAMAMVREQAAEVTVDRPFLFAITDTVTGLPLFLGRVTDPAAG